MSRIRLTIAYDGSSFRGWQSQPEGNTIQDNIEASLLRVSGEAIRVTGSGRTDTGVHALGQVAVLHFVVALLFGTVALTIITYFTSF